MAASAHAQPAQAGLQVEGQPARELRVGVVVPESVRSATSLEPPDEIAYPAVLCGAAPGREIEEEAEIDGDVEGQLPHRPFGPDQPRHLPTERRLLAGLAGEQVVHTD